MRANNKLFVQKVILFIISLVVGISSAMAGEKSGPECGGGGNGVLIGDQFVLIDLFNHHELNQVYKSALVRHPNLKTDSNNISLDAVNERAQFLLAEAGFATAHSQSLNSKIIESGAEVLKPAFQNNQVQMSEYYYAPFTPRTAPVFQAAYYWAEGHTVQISRVIWSRMNSVNKLALMIHENLRFYQQQNQISFNDKVLQNLTLALVVCPSQISGKLKNTIIANQNSESAVEKIQQASASCIQASN